MEMGSYESYTPKYEAQNKDEKYLIPFLIEISR